MKAIILFSTLFTLICVNISAQAPAIEWQKCFGGDTLDEAQAISQTMDGGYIVAGFTESNNGDVTGNHGFRDFWIIKLNSVGSVEWQKLLGGSNWDEAHSIQQTTDGGYVVCGLSNSTDGDVSGNHGWPDFWIVKLDSIGSLEWQKSLGGTDWDEAYSIQQSLDGGFLVIGSTFSSNGDITGYHGGGDIWAVKLDALGNLEWQKTLGGSDWDDAFSLQKTDDGGYIFAGASQSNNGDVSGHHQFYDYWVVKLDSLASISWQKVLGGTAWDVAKSVQQTQDGGYIVSGYSESNDDDVNGNHGNWDYWIVKLNNMGGIQWDKCLGGTGSDVPFSIIETIDKGYLLAGNSNSNDGDVYGNHGNDDYWIVKLDSVGIFEWQTCLGGSGDDSPYSLQNTTDGGYILAGYTESNDGDVTGNHGGSDMWIVKLEGFPISTPILENKTTCALYPNPVSNVLTIEHSFREIQPYTLLDVTGQLVLQGLLNTQKDMIDLKNLAEGTYLLKVGNQVKQVVKVGN